MTALGRRLCAAVLAVTFAVAWIVGGHWAWGLAAASAAILGLLIVRRPAGPSPAHIEIDRLLVAGEREAALTLARKSLRDAAGDWGFRLKVAQVLADAGEPAEALAALSGAVDAPMTSEVRRAVDELREALGPIRVSSS